MLYVKTYYDNFIANRPENINKALTHQGQYHKTFTKYIFVSKTLLPSNENKYEDIKLDRLFKYI